MLSRRHLLATGLAALGAASTRASAQQTVSALPPGWAPQIVPIQPGLAPYQIHVVPYEFTLYYDI